MSQNFYVRTSFITGGLTAESNRTIVADNFINATETIPAGLAGTAGSAGVMTLLAGHGITNSDIVSVYWATGFAYNCTVGSAGATEITVTGVEGDALPTSGAVVICKVTEVDISVLGTDVKALFAGGDVMLGIAFEDAGGVELFRTTATNTAYEWDTASGDANPITGDSIIKANVYNRSTTAGSVTIAIGYDNN